MTTSSTPTDLRHTTVPCPAWCEDKPGHPFDILCADETHEIRTHVVNVDTLVLDNDTRRRTEGAYVDIVADEERIDGGPCSLSAPLIALDASNVYLTRAEARQIAAALVKAADKLKEL